MNKLSATRHLPYKSVAAALLFSVILGPIGLLYSSFWGGLVLIPIGIIIINAKYFFPILFLWIICCVWAVRAVESSNQKIYRESLYK